MTTSPGTPQAVAELVGGFCYALLRVFHLAADAAVGAPDAALADRQTAFASGELERYHLLRGRLAELTDDAEGAMRSFRQPLDAFYETARGRGWLEHQVFTFIGTSITTDFAEILAPKLEPAVAADVVRALTGREEQERFALREIDRALADEGPAARERVVGFAGKIVGSALGGLRDALLESDALEVVLGAGEVKPVVLEILGRHRERLERLGLEPVDG